MNFDDDAFDARYFFQEFSTKICNRSMIRVSIYVIIVLLSFL